MIQKQSLHSVNVRSAWTNALLFAMVLSVTRFVAAEEKVITFRGMADASAVQWLKGSTFAVASDEDNILRLYDADHPGMPIDQLDLTKFLGQTKKRVECDLEGSARIGTRIYWIGSHSQTKKGAAAPARQTFFATDIVETGDRVRLKPVAKPVQTLLTKLAANAKFQSLHIAEALKKPANTIDSINIEGLAASPNGSLLIGFRSPIHDKRALVVELENPAEVIAWKEPKFNRWEWLDLGGLGIRSFEYIASRKSFWIVAGAFGEGNDFRMYEWSGKSNEVPLHRQQITFPGLHPEAMSVFPSPKGERILVLSDDGATKVDGKPMKSLPAEKQSFRAMWINDRKPSR